MPIAYHKSEWHKLTDAQRKAGTLEGEFLVFSEPVAVNVGPGTRLKIGLARVLPRRLSECEGCNTRARWIDRQWASLVQLKRRLLP
jgi:hypothetical protein